MVGLALAIPAFEDKPQARYDAAAESEARGQHAASLALRSHHVGETAARIRHHPEVEGSPHRERTARPDVPSEVRHHVSHRRVRVRDCSCPHRDLVTADPAGVLVRLRRIAEVDQHRQVIRVGDLGVTAASQPAEPDREQGRAQPVLHRLPHAHVAGQ